MTEITLDKFRDVDLVLDWINQSLISKQFVAQGDKNGRTFTVLITNNGEVGQTPGLTVNMRWYNRASGVGDLSAFEVLDASTNQFQFTYPENMLTPGKVDCEIQILVNGTIAHTKAFQVTVYGMTGNYSAAIEGQEFTALTQILAKANLFESKISSLELNKQDKSKAEQDKKELEQSLSETKAKLESNIEALSKNKVDKDGVMQVGWANLDQTARDNIAGDKVATVGPDSVGPVNIIDKSVTNPKLADEAVNTSKASILDFSVVKNSWAYSSQKSLWQTGRTDTTSYDKISDTLKFSKLQSGDNGVYVPIILPNSTTIDSISNYYVHLEATLSEGHSFTGNFEIYLTTRFGTLISSFYALSVKRFNGKTSIDVEIPKNSFSTILQQSEFRILLVLHGGTGSLKVNNLLVSNVANQRNLSETLSSADETSERYSEDFFRFQEDYEQFGPSGWFSSETYTIDKDGVYEIWWENGNPGISIGFSKDYFTFGKTFYLVGRARKLSGLEAGFTTTVYSNTADNLGTSVRNLLSTEWEPFVIPIVCDNSFFTLSNTLRALVQITTGDTNARIQIDNPRLYINAENEGNRLFHVLKDIGYAKNDIPEMANKLRKGQLPDFANITHTKIDASKYHFVTPDKACLSNGMVINRVDFYLENSQSDVQFVIGSIDQNNLIVETNRFQLDGTAGINNISLSKSVPIGYGERLFMDISGQKTLYDSDNKVDKTLVQDEDHVISGSYSGMTMYESDYMIPFSYSLRAKTIKEIVDGYENTIAEVKEEIDKIKAGTSSFAKDREGNQYALLVNANQTVTAIPIVPKKTKVFGNSLTLGFGTFGMAASNSSKDFSAKLLERIKTKRSDAVLQRVLLSQWEAATTSEARQAILDSLTFDGDEDLIIIQLGDNINTDDKRATFAEDASTLVKFMQSKAPHARIAWLNGWYNYNFVFPILEEIATETDLILIDIRALSVPAENKSKVGNQWTADDGTVNTITNSGVASHPGDVGMDEIADKSVVDLGF